MLYPASTLIESRYNKPAQWCPTYPKPILGPDLRHLAPTVPGSGTRRIVLEPRWQIETVTIAVDRGRIPTKQGAFCPVR
jgi:hypothetical protein